MDDSKPQRLAGLIIQAIFAVCAGSILLFFCSRHGANGCAPRYPSSPSAARLELLEGRHCRVAGDPGKWIAAGVTVAAIERWWKLVRANDSVGKSELELAGLILRIDQGTSGLLIDLGIYCEVRIESGPHAGLAVWIPQGFLVR